MANMNIRDVVSYQSGNIQSVDQTMTEEQRAIVNKVLSIVDRNPKLDWRASPADHNRDFLIIRGNKGEMNIEFAKEFMQKITFTIGISSSTAPPSWVDLPNDDKGVNVTVTCWFASEPRRTVGRTGGSTLRECGYPKNARAFHDAEARAQTRAMKICVEELVGAPFLNYLLLEVWGNYNVKGETQNSSETSEPRNVTPEDTPETRLQKQREEKWHGLPNRNKDLIRAIVARIQMSITEKVHEESAEGLWRDRAWAAAEDEARLAHELVSLNKEIDFKRTHRNEPAGD